VSDWPLLPRFVSSAIFLVREYSYAAFDWDHELMLTVITGSNPIVKSRSYEARSVLSGDHQFQMCWTPVHDPSQTQHYM